MYIYVYICDICIYTNIDMQMYKMSIYIYKDILVYLYICMYVYICMDI